MATDTTRAELIDAATRTFAEDGIATASLVEITRRAGQRNRGAVHYHFGGRDGLLVAVLEQQAAFLAKREGELLDIARVRPHEDVASVIEAIVRPAVELSQTGWRGRCYLMIVAELIELAPEARSEGVDAALAATGGHDVYALLAERMAPCDDDLRAERLALLTTFLLGAVSRRARDESGRSPLPLERFVDNLVDLGTAMVTARVR